MKKILFLLTIVSGLGCLPEERIQLHSGSYEDGMLCFYREYQDVISGYINHPDYCPLYFIGNLDGNRGNIVGYAPYEEERHIYGVVTVLNSDSFRLHFSESGAWCNGALPDSFNRTWALETVLPAVRLRLFQYENPVVYKDSIDKGFEAQSDKPIFLVQEELAGWRRGLYYKGDSLREAWVPSRTIK